MPALPPPALGCHPEPERKASPLSGGSAPQAQAHSLCPGPQQELVLRALPVEELKAEHVAGDALQLEAQVLHLQLCHLRVHEDGKLPQPRMGAGG